MSGPANEGKVDEMAKPRHTPGITARIDVHGVTRYSVRVRRGGTRHEATLPTMHEALAWQAQALSATAGLTAAPEPPPRRTVVSQAAGRAVTVEDAAIRLIRGMADGTVRTNKGKTYKPSTIAGYEIALRVDVLTTIGACDVATLRRGDIQQLVDALAASKSPASAKKAFAALSVSLRLCERYDELAVHPCTGVRVPAIQDETENVRALDAAEARHLLDAAEADDVKHERSFALPFLALLLGSGLRSGEALALRYGADGLDLASGTVHVRASLSRQKDAAGTYAELAPKTPRSVRTVALVREDSDLLRAHHAATGSPADGTLVFAYANGRPLAAHGLPRDTFQRVTIAAGLNPAPPKKTDTTRAASLAVASQEPTVTIHSLRHTYATHALRAGLTVHAVARLLGHNDASLVLRRYGHVLPDEMALAGATLGAWRESVENDGLARRLARGTMP